MSLDVFTFFVIWRALDWNTPPRFDLDLDLDFDRFKFNRFGAFAFFSPPTCGLWDTKGEIPCHWNGICV